MYKKDNNKYIKQIIDQIKNLAQDYRHTLNNKMYINIYNK